MENICRICLSSAVTLMDMFAQRTTAFDSEPSLVEKIMECAICCIRENDNLPQKICISCILNAETAFKFKRTCEKSQQILMSSKVKQEDTSVFDRTIKSETPEIILIQDSEITLKEPKIKREITLEEKTYEMLEMTLKEEEEDMEMSSLEDELPMKAVGKIKSTRQSQRTKVNESKVKNIKQTVICSPKSKEKTRSITPPTETVAQIVLAEFQCAQCLKILGSAYSLRNHSLVHTTLRPHKCPHCVQRFVRKGDLNAHIRTHTGERPYECEHCSKRFIQATHRSQHLRTQHGKFRFKCPHCPAIFLKRGNLNGHLDFHTDPKLQEVDDMMKKHEKQTRQQKLTKNKLT